MRVLKAQNCVLRLQNSIRLRCAIEGHGFGSKSCRFCTTRRTRGTVAPPGNLRFARRLICFIEELSFKASDVNSERSELRSEAKDNIRWRFAIEMHGFGRKS